MANLFLKMEVNFVVYPNKKEKKEFICIYKNYIPDGFYIYKYLITNLQITGIYDIKGIYGIGIENSVQSGCLCKS